MPDLGLGLDAERRGMHECGAMLLYIQYNAVQHSTKERCQASARSTQEVYRCKCTMKEVVQPTATRLFMLGLPATRALKPSASSLQQVQIQFKTCQDQIKRGTQRRD